MKIDEVLVDEVAKTFCESHGVAKQRRNAVAKQILSK